MTSVETTRSGNGHSSIFVFGDGRPLGWEAMEAEEGEARIIALGALRSAFRNLRLDASRGVRTKYQIDSRYLEDCGRVDNFTGSIVDLCAEATASDLSDIVCSNRDRHRRHERALSESGDIIRVRVVEGSEYLGGITPGDIPRDYSKTIAKIGSNLKPVDSFEAGGYFVNGYYVYQRKQPSIYLSNLFIDRKNTKGVGKSMMKTVFHEYTHALGEICGKGFFQGLTGANEPNMRLLEEPAAAYLTRVAANDGTAYRALNTNTLSGGELLGYDSYRFEQLLIDRLGVPADQFREAFFAERDDGNKSLARYDLKHLLDKSVAKHFPEFRENGFYQMAQAYNNAPRREREGLVRDWLDRMGLIVEDEVPDTEPSFKVVAV